MKVVNVFINKYNSGKLMGFANIDFSLDGSNEKQLSIKDFKIWQSKDGNGLSVSWPTKKDEKGKTDDKGPLYYPTVKLNIDDETGSEVARELFEHVRAEVEKAYHNNSSGRDPRPTTNNGPKTAGGFNDDLPF